MGGNQSTHGENMKTVHRDHVYNREKTNQIVTLHRNVFVDIIFRFIVETLTTI